ncbi:MAG: Gfo/Idh/MocA family oxidoreductase [Dehalococcoidia bacterium]
MRIGVIGLNHGHIYDMCRALLDVPGVELAGFAAPEAELAEAFAKRFQVGQVEAEQLLADPSVEVICTAAINGDRAEIAVRALGAGKHVFTDKPAMTTLSQLAEVEAAQQSSGKLFQVYYGERLGNPFHIAARELIASGEAGRVVSFAGFGPHRLRIETRPAWMFNARQYGGILNDIGTHQFELFSWLTGERIVEFTSRVGNFATEQCPEFEDYGDASFTGERGTAGYAQLHWFSQEGSPVWGDVRQMIVCTRATIDIRTLYTAGDPTGEPGLFLTTAARETSRVDVSRIDRSWGPQLVEGFRTGIATLMPQERVFEAARATLAIQAAATRIPGATR